MHGPLSPFEKYGRQAEQQFMYDFLPLFMLLLVSVTGLALTFMNIFMHGAGQPAMSLDSPMVSHHYIDFIFRLENLRTLPLSAQ